MSALLSSLHQDSYGDCEYYFTILWLRRCTVVSSHFIIGCLCLSETTRLLLCLPTALQIFCIMFSTTYSTKDVWAALQCMPHSCERNIGIICQGYSWQLETSHVLTVITILSSTTETEPEKFSCTFICDIDSSVIFYSCAIFDCHVIFDSSVIFAICDIFSPSRITKCSKTEYPLKSCPPVSDIT